MAEGLKTGGRSKGTPNKATREIKELCRAEGPDMVKALVRLANGAQSERARIAAIQEILDRGYGKAPQHVTVENDFSKMTGEQLARRFERAIAGLRSLGIDPGSLGLPGGDTGASSSQLTH